MNIENIVSIVLGVAGLICGIYFGQKAVSLKEKIRRFEWADVELGVRYLNEKISKKLEPDLILTISASGAIVANLFVAHRSKIIPVYIGITLKKDDERDLGFTTDHRVIMTSKWRIAVPHTLLRHNDKKLLILDGSVITGDAMSSLLDLLLAEGFNRKNILTAALITCDAATCSEKGPDISWKEVSSSDVYMPWGHLIGPGY